MSEVSFTVHGRPQQRGSKRPITNKKTGKTIMLDDNAKSRPWMNAVADAAAAAMNGRPLLDGPLRLSVTFEFKRPASHYGKRKGQSYLKEQAPKFVTTTPDADKLIRSIGDAMTGVVYRDDKQISLVYAHKVYTEGSEGAVIFVDRL